MRKVTVASYLKDKYYARVVRAVEAILASGDVVSPIDVLVHMELLSKSDTAYVNWGEGRRIPLRFSKTGDANLKEAYSRHFLVPGFKSKKRPSDEPDFRGNTPEGTVQAGSAGE